MPLAVPNDALTTLDKVKRYIGIPLANTDSDDLINELIGGVTQYIKDYCGREFLSQSYTEVYDTKNGRHKIFLKQIPVTAITSVKYRAGTPTSPEWITYNADSYLPYLKPGYIHFYGALPTVAQGMQIVYTAGYTINFAEEFETAAHTLPTSLTLAANEIIGNILNTRKAGGISSETTEGQTIQYDMKRAMTESVKTILNAHKLARIAS